MTKSKGPEAAPVPEGTWREDEMFKEMSGYGETPVLDDPWSSGFNLIGGGGILNNPEDEEEGEAGDGEENPSAVIFYLQELDSGEDLETRLTPDGARYLALKLEQWADDAEDRAQTVDAAIEKVRKSWYDKGGMMAGRFPG